MLTLHSRIFHPNNQFYLWLLLIGMLLLPVASALAEVGGGYTNAGLTGTYYNNPNFSGTPSFTRQDVRLNFGMGTITSPGGSPSPGYRDVPSTNWSAVWTGHFVPRFSETYTWKSFASNSVLVKIKKSTDSAWTLVINQGAYTGIDSVGNYGAPFTAGTQYDIEIDFAAATGPWGLNLRWTSPSTPEEVIDPLTQASLNALTYISYPEQLFANQMWGGRDEWMQPDINGGYSTQPAPRDASGWPMSDAINIVYEDSQDHHGNYLLQFQGQADVSVFFNFATFSVGGTNYGLTLPAGVPYDSTSGQGYNSSTNMTTAIVTVIPSASILYLKFVNSKRQPNDTLGTGITNVKLMKPTVKGGTTPYDISTLFATGFKNAAANVSTLRWLTANFNNETAWPTTSSPTYSEQFPSGSAGPRSSYEAEIEMSNETGKDVYMTIPMKATPDYVTKLANLIAYGADASFLPYANAVASPVYPPLNPNLRVYFEWSNEVPWNYAFAQAGDLTALVNGAAHTNSSEWQIINYDHVSDGTFDSNGNINNQYAMTPRMQALKTQEASQIFRSVAGDAAMGSRVRVLLEDQYGDPHGEPQFLDHYFNKTDPLSPYAGTPEPISYFIWGGGGAVYYDAQNAIGAQSSTVFANPSFEANPLALGATSTTITGWTVAGDAGIYSNNAMTIGAPPNAVDGAQAAYIADTGALSQTVNFATAGAYAISFSAAWGHFTYGADSQANPIRIFVDGTEVTPGYFNQGNYRYDLADAPWVFGSYGINSQAFNYVTTIVLPLSAGPHTIQFVGTGTVGQYFYLDSVAISSIDALYSQDIPATGGTKAAYASELNNEADWLKAYGLHRVSYEGGWALGAKPQVGGGDADTPFSDYARWSDPRAAQVSETALNLYSQSGGDIYGFGTYELWPAYDTDNAESYAILKGIIAAGNRLPAEPINGRSIPAVLLPGNITISDNANNGTINAADGWVSWNILVPASSTYFFTLSSSNGTPTILIDDATQVASGKSAFLTKGLHSAKIRSMGGTVTVTSLTVSVPAAPAAPALTASDGDGSVSLKWTPVSGAIDYEVAYGTSSGEYTIMVDAGAATSLTVTGLTNSQTYFFVVYAYNSSGQSLPSNEQAVVPLANNQLGTLATWNFEGYAGSEPSALPTSATSRAVVSSLTRGIGLNPTNYHFPNTFGSEAAGNYYAQNLFDSVTANQYYQFTVAPASGKKLNLKSLTFLPFFQNAQGGTYDPRGAGITYSTDNGNTFSPGIVAAGTPTYSSAGSTFSVDLSQQATLQNTSGPVVFRAYLYGNGAYEFSGIGGGGQNGILLAGSFGAISPTVATPASATPNPVTGTTTKLSVLGADAEGENKLIYTWTTVGTLPAPVIYSANGTNAAKNTNITFTAMGTYIFQVIITNPQGAAAISSVAVTVQVALASISFRPSTVTGGANITGTLTLTGPAPSGAAIVHLTSSNPAALYVPPTAQLNAGLTSRTFTAVSKNVTTAQTVTVTATYNGTSATATVTVNPAPVYIGSVSFNPSTVTAGANTTGTLTLTGPAPAGNAVVQLSSSNPAALYVPATAQISAGLTSRTVTAVSKYVNATTTVTVTATYNGTSTTTTVTVNPAPVYIGSVSFSPSSVTAGGTTTGTLTLTGPAPSGAAIVHLTSSNTAAFYVPATAQINPGITGRTFTAVSKNVTTAQTVTVTATYNGTSKTTQVTVTP